MEAEVRLNSITMITMIYFESTGRGSSVDLI